MELLTWIGIYLASALFWIWILFLGDADWLEGSMLAGFLIHFRATNWSVEGLHLFAAASWFLQTIWFIAGLFRPGLRIFLP